MARSLYISLISEIDCTMDLISFSLSSIMTVVDSTMDSWWSVNPWRKMGYTVREGGRRRGDPGRGGRDTSRSEWGN